MKSIFDTLVTIRFSHSYFGGGIFSGLNLNVRPQTVESAKNMGLLIKPFSGGFIILYDQAFGGRNRTREDVLNENLRLEFTLNLTDPHFYSYTAGLPPQIDNSVYYFNNSASAQNDTGLLHKAEFASEKDIYKVWYFKERFFNKPFAKLDITTYPGLKTEYFARFQAIATRWRYILVSDYLQQLKKPAIIGGDNGKVFGEPLKVTLPDNRQVSAFVSDNELSLAADAAKVFQLVENYENGSSQYRVVIRALPRPDVRLISKIDSQSNPVNYSDILIH